MKRILLFAISLVFVAFTSSAQMTNGGFETWTDTNPDGWGGVKTGSGVTVTKVTTDVHGGSNACGLTNAYDGHSRFTTTGLTVVDGTAYGLSFWVRGTGDVRTSMTDGDAIYLTYTDYVATTSTWTQISVTLTATFSTDSAEFIIDLGSYADFVIDDVVITGLAAANPVTAITVSGASSATTITTEGGTLQMSADVLPVDADDTSVTWSVVDGTGHATIDANGLLTAVLDGTVTVTATANDGSGITGTLEITLSNQAAAVMVTEITVSSDSSVISTYHGTLQMTATVTPDSATISTVTWSVVDGTGSATIDASGLLTASTDGTVTVTATADDASGVTGTLVITLSNQVKQATPIYDIQYTTDASGDSPLNGQSVMVQGTVTGLEYNYEGGTYNGFFIQDAEGAYNGIYVYDNNNTPTVGDIVSFTATVSEYNGLTELSGLSEYTVVSQGNTIPTPVSLSTADAATEGYEGVLISVKFAECVSDVTNYGDFNVNDGSGDLNVDNDMYEFVPTLGKFYDITGIGHYGYGVAKILPRDSSDVSEAAQNTEAEIAEFSLLEQTGAATIDASAGTIAIEVYSGTDVTALVPTITVSAGATISPVSGVAQDFTSAVVYTVTAQDGSTTKTWTVTVTISTTLNTAADIIDVVLSEQTNDAVLTDSTVTLEVAPDVDLTALVPTITVSAGATISPVSGVAQDFTSAVVYTVTAQDGSTTKTWTVTVNKQTLTSVYDIQNSTGDSPYKNQVVTTEGVVSAVKDYDSSSGLLTGYFIQDGTGEFSGLYVESADLFSIGNKIYVTGTITEKYNHTIMNTVTSSKLILPSADVVTNEITAAQANTEAYESVLVSVSAPVVSAPDSYGTWVIGDGTDNINVDDVLLSQGAFDAISFTVGDCKAATGVIYYSYGEFNILPRSLADVSVSTACNAIDEVTIANIDLYPNPVNSTLNINNIEDFSSIKVSNLLGQEVSNMSVNSSNVEVSFKGLEKGIYFVSLYEETTLVKTFKVIKN